MKTIEEGNKLIAEFMGITPIVENNGVVYKDPNTGHIMLIRYHTSWDWLMPVVEKIESLGYGVTIYRKGCHINDIGLFGVNGFNHKSKIEQTWLAVVEFIKWYNNH